MDEIKSLEEKMTEAKLNQNNHAIEEIKRLCQEFEFSEIIKKSPQDRTKGKSNF